MPRSLSCQEAMDNVRTKVDAEADADDENIHGGDVDCESPPVHETLKYRIHRGGGVIRLSYLFLSSNLLKKNNDTLIYF